VSAPENGGERTPSFTWRRVILGGVLAFVVASGVVALIGHAAGFGKLSDILSEGDPAWLLACALGQLVVFGGYAVAFRGAAAFEGGPRIAYNLSLRVVLGSFALTQLIAFGGAAGIAVTFWALRKLRFDRRESAVRVIGLNTLVYAVFGVLGWIVALLAFAFGLAPPGMTLPWLLIIPTLIGLAYWFTSAQRVAEWAAPVGGLFRRGIAIGVSAAWWVRRVVAAVEGRTMVIAACVYWVGDIASLWAGLKVFDASPGLIPLTLAYATGYVASLLPVPFIATGGVDAATTFALTAVGVPLEAALLGVVAHRLFAFWIPVIPGIILAALLPTTGRALDRAAATREPEVRAATAT
jgi:uncharacterized membrane protein YbhN (UPF0104 family)